MLNKLLADLVRINSVNSFYAGGPGEAELADFVERYFHAHGLETWRSPCFLAAKMLSHACPAGSPSAA